MFIIEPFDYVKHIQRVCLMELSQESTETARASTLVKSLGFSLKQVLLDALIGSEEAIVILDPLTHRVRGIAGASQAFTKTGTVVYPWCYTDGFEHEYPIQFVQLCRQTLRTWEHWARGKQFVGELVGDHRTQRLLEFLGFTVSPGHKPGFINFKKKGGNHYVRSSNGLNAGWLIPHGNTSPE